MKTDKNPRNYSCKDEELPVIGGYVLASVRRDQAKFEAYSPNYGGSGLDVFEQEIARADELVNPRLETNELKLATGRLYATMDDMYDRARHIGGYIAMSRGAVPVTAKDFGITALKRQAKVRDAEGVVQSARLVLANMRKYLEPLAQQGLTDAMTNDFAAGIDAIVADNRLQYDIVNNRKATVQANLDILNELYRRIMEICIAGKILFGTNAGKLKEYTFSELKKQVRHTSRKPGTDGQSAKNEGRPAQ